MRKLRNRQRWVGLVMGVVAGVIGAPSFAAAQQQVECDCPSFRFNEFPGIAVDARPKLGIILEATWDRDLEDWGARVIRVWEGGPAAEAGIEAGDVVVSVDGHDLAKALEDQVESGFREGESLPTQRMIALSRELEEGDPIEVVVDREGERLSLTVTPEVLDEGGYYRPDPAFTVRLRSLGDRLRELTHGMDDRVARWEADLTLGNGWIHHFGSGRIFGLDLVDLNPGLGAYFGTYRGVLVADVAEDSGLGLRPGDVVVGVEGREVEDAEELRRILRSYEEGDEMDFRIWRDGAETTVTGSL